MLIHPAAVYRICTVFIYNYVVAGPAPALDEPLTQRDAENLLDVIIEAKTKSRELGRALNLPDDVVTKIHDAYGIPTIHLYHVIQHFLKSPNPTRKTIGAALRSPAVYLPRLATRVEAAHFPDPTATHEPPSLGIYLK